MDEIFLEGIKIKGYRSFKEEVAFENLSKINLIIGQNNSGKSNLLRFLSKHFILNSQITFNDLEDVPKHSANQDLEFGVQVSKNTLFLFNSMDSQHHSKLQSFLFNNRPIWFYYGRGDGKALGLPENSIERTIEGINHIQKGEWEVIWNILTKMTGGELSLWKKESIKRLNPLKKLNAKVDLIPAFRTLKPLQPEGTRVDQDGRVDRDGIGEHSGVHLISGLFKLQNPPLGKERDRERFNKINGFMREVIGNDSLQLNIPHDETMVIVEMDGKRLPIESLGTGIEEILIIAAKSTMFSNQIVCIEEPELHLHPTLQKKLINYLFEETNNQYFIATHSAHLLDTVPASIFHIKLEDGYSRVISALSDKEKFDACVDLGYKASDLLQANFIIWVEGPSDRIYLKAWIEDVAPDLEDGLHFSIMFYGGRLLNHLSANEDAIGDFIDLRRLNQNMAIVIDSDKRKEGDEINSTKKRVKEEFEKSGYFVWITEGKEIENYISGEVFKKIVPSNKNAKKLNDNNKFSDRTVYYDSESKNKNSEKKLDKIKLANSVVAEGVDLSVLDLKSKVDSLVESIRSANLLDV